VGIKTRAATLLCVTTKEKGNTCSDEIHSFFLLLCLWYFVCYGLLHP